MLMGGFSHFVGHISRFFHVLQGTLQKWSKWKRQSRIFSQIFFHLFNATENRAPHRALIHALGLGDLSVGHAQNKVGIYPAALGFRQAVQRVPQTAEPLLEPQNLVRVILALVMCIGTSV